MQHSWRYILTQSWTEKFKHGKLLNNTRIYPTGRHGELKPQSPLTSPYAEPRGRVIFMFAQLEHFSEYYAFDSLLKTVCKCLCFGMCYRCCLSRNHGPHHPFGCFQTHSSMLISPSDSSRVWRCLRGEVIWLSSESLSLLSSLPFLAGQGVTCPRLGSLFSSILL